MAPLRSTPPGDSMPMESSSFYPANHETLAPERSPKNWLLRAATLFALLGLLLMAGSLVLRIDAGREASQLSGTTLGTVSLGGQNEAGQTCSLSYSYTVQGKELTAAIVEGTICGKDQREGAKRTVYYDPYLPTHSVLEDPWLKLDGTPWRALFGAGAIAMLAAAVSLVLGLRGRRRAEPVDAN